MPTTTNCNFGDVVLVRFPFTDQAGTKQPPAAIVSNAAYQRNRPDVILLAITSQIRPTLGFGEALVAQLARCGLTEAVGVQADPVHRRAERSLLRKTLGTLVSVDQQTLHEVLQRILG